MSLFLTNHFLKEFNLLDRVLRDMYDSDVSSKLGITRYLEAMQEQWQSGYYTVPHWAEDYERLKALRNSRNQAVHENMLDGDLFNETDMIWITEFRQRILNCSDPLSVLRRRRRTNPAQRASSSAPTDSPRQEVSSSAQSISPRPKSSDSSAMFFAAAVVLFFLIYLFLK